MKIKRIYSGSYKVVDTNYTIEQNIITKEWHIYHNGEWDIEAHTLKQAKEMVRKKIETGFYCKVLVQDWKQI